MNLRIFNNRYLSEPLFYKFKTETRTVKTVKVPDSSCNNIVSRRFFCFRRTTRVGYTVLVSVPNYYYDYFFRSGQENGRKIKKKEEKEEKKFVDRI